ncbi:Na+/H+ antiporter NhaC family protein [Jeotgalibacillus sp. R-1-5s-1]|uniref:Na+/H+ antiporter NhaC family protein n=1 Tax=Jeotgalibacillus sp. R-1-5s-1 TaxID=2555897 RepID=UPI00106A5B75|nr:Na+/H+ antiporter NhaC family protein [Jeotgalibacillus sp. R-1-5s-1]TFD95907.1 Na+/H+ antiporter NhaC family protein [Jeotgalibacillus sp. R-1-5s-1]
MEGSWLSLLPPVIAILMVVLTRRVLLSLGAGIVAAALLLTSFSPVGTLQELWMSFSGVFWEYGSDGEPGALNLWNIFIMLFLLILGVITAFINISGGARAFGEWAMKRVKTRAGAQLVTACLGVVIFIDDYFNSLAVGQVARPITDRHRVSRAKLAYLIDSTAAPVCVVSPVSSWGAYIIAVIGGILATHSITEYTAFSAFIQMVPMNLYVWAALGIVFIVALRGVDFGQMRVHENRAIETGEVYDKNKDIPGELKNDLPTSSHGTVGDLIWPIIALVVGTVASMMYTGAQAYQDETGQAATLLQMFEYTDVAKSLVWGALVGLAVAIILFIRQVNRSNKIGGSEFVLGLTEGVKSMLPAIYILVFAWMIVGLIDSLGTGVYLAGLVEQSNLPIGWLPVLLFLVAGIMAFSTGTSWGSFGILLPIAGQIAATTDVSLLLPALAAVLAGAVFGDHCSPISDTTILSSTGAGSNHIDHVTTQIPYAVTGAVIASAGYILLGFSGNTWLALGLVIVLLALFAVIMGRNPEKARVVSAEEGLEK